MASSAPHDDTTLVGLLRPLTPSALDSFALQAIGSIMRKLGLTLTLNPIPEATPVLIGKTPFYLYLTKLLPATESLGIRRAHQRPWGGKFPPTTMPKS